MNYKEALCKSPVQKMHKPMSRVSNLYHGVLPITYSIYHCLLLAHPSCCLIDQGMCHLSAFKMLKSELENIFPFGILPAEESTAGRFV